MNQSTTRVFLTTTILVLTRCSVGCEDTGQTADNRLPVVVQDSAGITIVENDPPAPDSRLPWEFSAQPSLTIGAVDSGEADELFRVTDAIRLADGRIVIANSGSSEIRVFNPDGSHSATWGGQGEGPGEFTNGPHAVALWPGDSIAAPNPWGARLSLFDMDGNHGRDVALDITLSNIVDLLPDGQIVTSGSVLLNREMAGSPNLVRYDTEWAVLNTDGTLLASLGEFLSTEERAVSMPDGGIGETPHPFRRGTLGAVWGELVAVDRIRPRGADPGPGRDSARPGHLRDRRRLRSGIGRGRPGRGIRAALGVGPVAILLTRVTRFLGCHLPAWYGPQLSSNCSVGPAGHQTGLRQ